VIVTKIWTATMMNDIDPECERFSSARIVLNVFVMVVIMSR
jgi:hypothetical protein